MRKIKQSTTKNVMVLMVDSTDHVTGKTGLTLTITASKDGAAFASITPTVTERGNGWYNLALTAGHTDTLGDFALHITGTAADPADIVLLVEAGATDADVSSRMATYTQPTGFLAATFPTTVASTTNITAGTITTVTNLTNLPSIPSNWLTAAGIAASALDNKGNWNVGKTGYSLTATTGLGNQTANITGNLSGSVGSVTGLTAANLDVAVSTRLATAGYTAPDNAGISSNGSAIAALNDITVADILGATVPDTYTVGQVGYQLGLIAAPVAGSTSLNTRATGFVLTTGSETNSYSDTRVADGTLHTIDDDTNVIDCYYEAEVGQTGIPVAVSILANLQSGNDIVTVYGYNWGTTSWEAVGTLPGTGSSSLSNYSWPLFGAHVGTGANLGKVRVRFAILSGGSNPSLQIDLFYVQYAVVATDSMFEGQAQSGTSASITFPTTANANNDYYIPGVVVLTGGTGAGQASRITAYNGTTKVADVATPWVVTPDATTTFAVKHWSSVRVQNMEDNVITAASIASDAGAEIATAVWDKVLS